MSLDSGKNREEKSHQDKQSPHRTFNIIQLILLTEFHRTKRACVPREPIRLSPTSWRRDAGALLATGSETLAFVPLWKAVRDQRCRASAVRKRLHLRDLYGGEGEEGWGQEPARECWNRGWSQGSSRCLLSTQSAEKSLTTPEKVAILAANRFRQ